MNEIDDVESGENSSRNSHSSSRSSRTGGKRGDQIEHEHSRKPHDTSVTIVELERAARLPETSSPATAARAGINQHSDPHGLTAGRPAPRRHEVLYVRVTSDEKRRILARATRSRLSVSRFLARTALDGRAPPTLEERARLEALLLLLKQTHQGLHHLRAQAEHIKLFTVMPGVEADFHEAEDTLQALIREMAKRL